MRWLWFMLTVILLAGCLMMRPQYVRNGLKQLDSLSVMLREIEKRLMLIDSNQLKNTYKLYQQSISLLQHIADTAFKQDEWQVLTLYGQIKKPLRNYLFNLPQFYRELEYSRKQIATLQHDLKWKIITRSDFERYIATEKEAVSRFYESFFIHTHDIESKVKLFDSLYPRIQLIIHQYLPDDFKNISQ